MSLRKAVVMGVYTAMMKVVHDHAKKLEKSGQLERMFQQEITKQSSGQSQAPRQESNRRQTNR